MRSATRSSFKSPFTSPIYEGITDMTIDASKLTLLDEAIRGFTANIFKYHPNEAVYLQSLVDIVVKGRRKMSRPGQETLSLAGTRAEYDLTDNKIPLLRSKRIFNRSFMVENQWFISGSDDVGFLKANNVSIWDSWVIPETAVFAPTDKQTGFDIETYIRCHIPEAFKLLVTHKRELNIGIPTATQMMEFISFVCTNALLPEDKLRALNNIPCVKLVSGKIGAGAYGPAWRNWQDTRIVTETNAVEHEKMEARGFTLASNHDLEIDHSHHDVYKRNIDQLLEAVQMLRKGADSRRIIVSAWNAAKIDEAALPPCHSFFQFVSYDNFDGGPRDLVCVLHQRSADKAVGTPFNVAQYAALTHLMAHITNHRATKLIVNVGDDHIYEDQLALLPEQLIREPISLPSATIEYPAYVKELSDFIHLDAEELAGLIHGYEEGTYHPRLDYPVAV